VRDAADFVTDSNNEDGFAKAIERFVLGDVRLNAPTSKPLSGALAHAPDNPIR
jgi:hypothetical protein